MKIFNSLATLSICMLFSSAVWAADQDDHKAHHPDAVASSSKATKGDVKTMSKNESEMHDSMAKESMEKMDGQMKVMNDMHEKMMNAKTPDERKSLMAEHMKAMHGGMAMMNDISKSCGMSMMDNTSNSTMKSDTKSKMQDGMNGDMAMHHKMMEKRMQMMETMMQMMMDRMTP